MSGHDDTYGKPADEMRATPPGTEDQVGEIALLAADPDSDDDEILRKLNALASSFTAEEIFTALVRFDVPDVLG
ncbi:hypothetical protein [Actinoplanes sp. NPDC051411]|uniref:hypothetical protein n=1 Tax=Actinoplanes sp. NPDC051411 TaxID=3155522 RepID=UPI003423B4D7